MTNRHWWKVGNSAFREWLMCELSTAKEPNSRDAVEEVEPSGPLCKALIALESPWEGPKNCKMRLSGVGLGAVHFHFSRRTLPSKVMLLFQKNIYVPGKLKIPQISSPVLASDGKLNQIKLTYCGPFGGKEYLNRDVVFGPDFRVGGLGDCCSTLHCRGRLYSAESGVASTTAFTQRFESTKQRTHPSRKTYRSRGMAILDGSKRRQAKCCEKRWQKQSN